MQDRETAVAQGLGPLLPRLWRFAVVLTRDRAAAEDLVQATCLRALERARQFDPGTRLDHWAFAVMVSIWRNELRRRSAFGRIVGRGLAAPGEGSPLSAEDAQTARQAAELVASLPEAQREVAALVYFEDFTYREAAEALGLPVGTVTSRMHAVRAALARLLGNPAQPAYRRPAKEDR
jgi:RNA polymerase sigma-70 factor (ECF subfamily)